MATAGTADAASRAALFAVGADWAAELPECLDTQLGPGGMRLDAAKAQQLALARVVLADPHTVVLDEATSLLDPTTARRTERSLAALRQGRTVIAIAHHLHTAHAADRVAVVEGRRARSSARTTSWSPPMERTPRCGVRGTEPTRPSDRLAALTERCAPLSVFA
ncbi:ABC transporter ATP-binding protein [Micromonospora viridifaciens]|uniref:ABC transporter ATP-binding protein n=1 Tax=Micromonospora viridifaciens TaxID=1881 RepID=UPI0018D59972